MIKKIKKYFNNLGKKITLTKREIFAVIVGILTFGFLLIELSGPELRYILIGVLAILTYALFAFGLREELSGIEWLTLFILPVLYVVAMSLFYFLLPVRWLTRLPTAVIFAIGMYAILLIENIYNVAAERTIQLLRAAHSVGLLLTLFTDFLLMSIIFSLHLPYLGNFLLTFFVSLLLSVQALWAMRLDDRINSQLVIYSFTVSFVLAELAFIFSFWPIQTILEALFLTTIFYTLVGMVQQYLLERLFRQTATEFISVSIVVLILVLATTRWG